MPKKKTNPSAPPEPAVNVDWDKINAKYWATVDKWIEQGLDIPATRQRKAMLEQSTKEEARDAGKQRPSRAKPPGSGPGRGQKPQYDRAQMVHDYTAGHTVEEVAERLGCSIALVRATLKERGVFVPYRDGHGKPKEPKGVCVRGHDLSVHGRVRWKKRFDGVMVSDGRDCMECNRMRGRNEI